MTSGGPAEIGHNDGPPLDPGRSWRRFAWRKARAAIAPPAPLEVVRRHVRRARALGLPYPVYASIRLGTGRDVRALMVTGRALGQRRRIGAEALCARLASVEAAELLLLSRAVPAPAGRPALALGLRFAAAGPAPHAGAGWGEVRAAVLALTRARALPRDTVVMIGSGDREKAWATAAALARFVPAADYGAGAAS